jgi:hypothetical protein
VSLLFYCTISINSARHTSQAPVLCRKLALVTGHKGQCQRGQTCDSAKKSKIGSKTGHFTAFTTYFAYFGLRSLQPPLTGHKTLKTANFGIVQCRNFCCHSHRPFVSKCRTGPTCHSHRGVSNWTKWYSIPRPLMLQALLLGGWREILMLKYGVSVQTPAGVITWYGRASIFLYLLCKHYLFLCHLSSMYL